VVGLCLWTQKGVNTCIVGRTTCVLAVREKVSIEIDVVLVRSSDPGHSKWVQNMNKNQCRVVGEGRQPIKELKLDSGAGKSFDTMNTGRMDEGVPRGLRSKPADVDTQGAAGRRTGRQFQDMEPAARFLHLGTKLRPSFLVLLGKM